MLAAVLGIAWQAACADAADESPAPGGYGSKDYVWGKMIHERAEGTVSDPLELCRSATTALCASVPEGSSCYQDGVECNPIDESSTRCAPVERERVRPLMGPR